MLGPLAQPQSNRSPTAWGVYNKVNVNPNVAKPREPGANLDKPGSLTAMDLYIGIVFMDIYFNHYYTKTGDITIPPEPTEAKGEADSKVGTWKHGLLPSEKGRQGQEEGRKEGVKGVRVV
ncbi:hypothetical protein FSARC_552 [Fusarium sarcochroum]|uniref:Uncharacterized protein n=1 Tax=Fusarium sarcochroum TaxID=1208366 RepID=A0A8H4XGB0_9HYPO|nr:hypothetical protein FSARC_552 [Fusarium sarcochroum]